MQTRKHISALEVIKYGFVTLFEHIGFIAIAIIVAALATLGFVLSVLLAALMVGWLSSLVVSYVAVPAAVQSITRLFFVLFLFLFLVGIDLGFVRVYLDLYLRDRSSLSRVFSCMNLSFKGLIAGILYALIVCGGLLLFIIPGIIWSIRFGLWRWFIVDKNAGIVESLRLSYRATKGYSWPLFSMYILHGVIYILLGGFISYMRVGGFMFHLDLDKSILDAYPVLYIVRIISTFVNGFVTMPAFGLAYTKFYKKLPTSSV